MILDLTAVFLFFHQIFTGYPWLKGPYLTPDHLEKLAIGRSRSDVQIDKDATDSRSRTKHMDPAIDTCSKPKIRRTEKPIHFAGKTLPTDTDVKALEITLSKKLS